MERIYENQTRLTQYARKQLQTNFLIKPCTWSIRCDSDFS